MRNFMISFPNLEVENEIKLRDLLGEHGYKFWHRFPNTWIVITPDDVTTLKLTDSIDEQLGIAAKYVAVQFAPEDVIVSVTDSMKSWFENHLELEFGAESIAKRRERENAEQK